MARRIGGAGGGSDPGSSKVGGFVAAVVIAGAAAGGLGGGAASLGGPSSGGTTNLSAKKAEGKKAARKGDADEAWQRMSMRTLKKTAKQDLKCVAHSFGQVRDFFARNPCKSLDRALFAVGDSQGNTVVVSVAWVGFRSRSNAREFRDLNDVHGIGDVTPLAGALLELAADIRFTGHHYQSRLDGATVVIAETETATGKVSGEVLDAVADVAVWLPGS